MKPSQLLSKQAWDKARSTGLDYTDALILVRHENPGMTRAADSGAHSMPEIANARAGTNRAEALRKKNSAKTQFFAEVKKLTDRGHKYDAAFQICQREHVEIANEMNAPLPSAVTIPAMTSGTSMQLNMSSEIAMLMGISAGTVDNPEIKAVFNAIGRNLTPADYGNIWGNLKNYWAGKDTGLSPQDTEIFLRSRFPALTARLISLNILQANNTPDSPAASAFARTLAKL